MIEIKVNSIYGTIPYHIINNVLNDYTYKITKKGKFIKKYKKSISPVNSKGQFYIGLLPDLLKELDNLGYKYTITNEFNDVDKEFIIDNPYLHGISLREDQKSLINIILSKKRGIIQSATGTGKTITSAGFISCFRNNDINILWLVHNVSLLSQTETVFNKLLSNFFDITTLSGTNSKEFKQIFSCRYNVDNVDKLSTLSNSRYNKNVISRNKPLILISTIQSFSNVFNNLYDYFDLFDIVTCDECHHIGYSNSLYSKIFSQLKNIYRIGLTATPVTKEIDIEKYFNITGHIGNVIGSLTIDTAIKGGLLVDIKTKFINVAEDKEYNQSDKLSYREVYNKYIVNNNERNDKIILVVQKNIKNNLSNLIVVNQIEHGHNLMGLLKDKKIDSYFVQGSIDSMEREKIRLMLHNKEVMVVICTTVWKEGIDIPSLDTVINAAGGISEIALMQTIGRGTRTAVNKNHCLIIDFLDPYKYLSSHSIKRLQVYNKNNWIK